MRIAIIGFPGSGKSTVFSALTGMQGAGQEQKVAAVQVPDERVKRLSELYNPKKTIYASVEFVDLGTAEGMRKDSDELGPKFLSAVRPAQALIQVIDAFSIAEFADQMVAEAIDAVDTELAMADFEQCEKRISRLKKQGIKPGPMQAEADLLQSISNWLSTGKPLRLNPDLCANESLRSFSFLSAKPIVTVINTSEESLAWTPAGLPEEIQKGREGQWGKIVPLSAQLESEIASLSPADSREFLSDYGIESPARERVIKAGFDLLGCIPFFTVGTDEVRAWTILNNTSAKEAAAAIHSDISRGFIRAEVADYQTVIELKSFDEARKNSRVKLEGKDYIVKNGDIINFRYNV
jgi:GTP-binding protein YchF